MVPLFLTSVVVVLVLLQPDFGTAVIITTTVLFMFFIAGGRVMHLAGLAAAIAPVAVFLLVRESYRVQRIMAFRSPWDDPSEKGYQIIQSFISFGSGGIFGVGLGNSMQKLFYLPEPPHGLYSCRPCRRGRVHSRCRGDTALCGAPGPGIYDRLQG